MGRDGLVKLDRKRQPAEVLGDAADHDLESIRVELPSADHLEDDRAVFALNRLELAD
jgi:hypothetical protein